MEMMVEEEEIEDDEVKETKMQKWLRLLQENEEKHQPDLNRYVLQPEIPFRMFSQEMFNVLGELGKFLYPGAPVEGEDAPVEEEEDEDGEDYILIGINVYSCYKEKDGETYYQGQWFNGTPYGQGQQIVVDGTSLEYYEGEFKEGMYHGEGRKIYHNGSYYLGQFRNDQMQDKNAKYVQAGENGIKI